MLRCSQLFPTHGRAMGCIMTITVCIYGDRAARSHRLLAIKIKEREFCKENRWTRVHQVRVRVHFRKEPPITPRSWGGRDSSKHNFELRQVFQDRGCRRGFDATHTCVLTICDVHIPPFPRLRPHTYVCPCRRCNPQRLPSSVTEVMRPAGVAVTDSEENSNMGHDYKVY